MNNNVVHVLLIEDNTEDAELLQVLLSREVNPRFEFECRERLSLGLDRLKEGGIDVVLLDLSLPDGRGEESFDKVRSAAQTVPIIILTGFDDEQIALNAMRKGAYNYLLKGRVDRQILTRSMLYAIQHQKRESELLISNEIMQEEMDRFFSLSLDMFCVVGFDGILKVVNPAWKKTFGWEMDSLLSKPVIEFVHPSDQEATLLRMQALSRGEPIINFENRFLCKDGTYKWLQWDANPLVGRQQIYAVARDITEKRRSDQRLREMGLALENAVEGIARIDTESKFLAVNRAYAKIVGYRPEEMVGHEWTAFIHADDKSKVEQTVVDSLKNGKAEVELKVSRKDLAPGFVELSLVKTANDRQEFTGFYSFMKDITPRILEAQRQSELMSQLEKVNRELNEFSYVVSHDLKAPLRGIGSLVSWLATDYADKFDDEGKENLRLLVGRLQRMHDLIDGLLQLAKVGRIENKKEKLDMNLVIQEAVDFLSPPPNIKVEIEPNMPDLLFAKVEVQQVIQNLISNAIKYMDKPHGIIKVSWTENDQFLTFHVHDNGPGIQEKHFGKIFQIFQTLAPRDSCESTGIGLSLVKKIVEMNGGKVGVESKVGEGSTFSFSIPKEGTPGGHHVQYEKQTT